MAETAGSKYGVVKDELPVKSNKIKPRKRLKSIRRILNRRIKIMKQTKMDSNSGGTNNGEALNEKV